MASIKAGTPFRTAMLMSLAIASIQTTFARDMTKQRVMLEALGPYESRGSKGEGRSNRRAPGAGMAAKRASVKRRNVMRHRKACRG